MTINPLMMITIAKNEVGYLEKAKIYKDNNEVLDDKLKGAGQDNMTKYWRDLAKGYQGQPWCNAFVNWCFIKAYGLSEAKRLLCTDGAWSYYTPTSASYFKQKGQWYTKPQVGDVIFFKNSTRICHVGIVTKVDNSNVYTVEGNTSSAKGVVANGGSVNEKQYKLSYKNIAGYGRPNYSNSVSENLMQRKTIGLGARGEDVRYLHKRLRTFKYGVSENNDKFDELTEQCVKHFQATHKACGGVDGIVGAKTWSVLG